MIAILGLISLVLFYYVLYHTRIGKSLIEFLIEFLNSF